MTGTCTRTTPSLTPGRRVITEAELQAEVVKLARSLGLECPHLRAPRREGDWKGFPDLMIVQPGGGIMFRELKRAGEQLRADQKRWQHILAGQDHDVWRPADWYAGRIQRELHDLAEREPPEPGPPATVQERLWRALQQRARQQTEG